MSHPSRHPSQIRVRIIKKSLGLILLATLLLTPVQAAPPVSLAETDPPPSQSSAVSSVPIRPDPALLGPVSTSEIPLRLIIPRLLMDLPVVEAPVVNGYWLLSDTSLSHGAGSANPGASGNVVIFGHARQGLFLPLRQIKAGDTIYVLTASRWHAYQVSATFEVSPADVQVISPSQKDSLTLFTCSGFADAKRLIVKAYPPK